ncbi:hypothetical protein OS493_010371 [Desmophyllum pertusum]|uniref:Uncharacterized protein n=1 Tax=Desmophyllum pertusum TaxID=174260 RepID=A0A9X0A3F1_9CNID|nr:hypothetical protein OS493_010371 [Desmophyllum pertusum]
MGGPSEGFGVGVVRCSVEVEEITNGRVQPLRENKTQWIWSSDSKCLRKTGHQINEVQRSPTTNAYFGNSDVIELYLDCDNQTLMMYNQRTKRSDTWQWQGVRGLVCPVFQLCTNGDEVSLRL